SRVPLVVRRTPWFAVDASRPSLAYDHLRLLIARAALLTSRSMRGSRHAACGVRSRISAQAYPGIRLAPSRLSQPSTPQRISQAAFKHRSNARCPALNSRALRRVNELAQSKTHAERALPYLN